MLLVLVRAVFLGGVLEFVGLLPVHLMFSYQDNLSKYVPANPQK